MKDRLPCRQGYTLIELSIVLVIIGLLVGGVLVGRDMIRQSEIRSVITEVERFKVATNAFKVKYNCLPGDCAVASQYGLGNDGNGNGVVDEGWCGAGGIDSSAAGNAELFLFWQHLANAGLIAGTFTGQASGGNAIAATIGVNVPPSKLSNGGYSVVNMSHASLACSGYMLPGSYANAFIIGKPIANDRTGAPILTPSEAASIDQKIDDGLPTGGTVVTMNSTWFSVFGWPNCVSDDSASAVYNLTLTTLQCHLIFNRSF